MTPEQRVMRARAGGYAKAALYAPDELVGPARRGFLARFAHQVDPDLQLDDIERERRARAALRSHMQVLALRSSLARGGAQA